MPRATYSLAWHLVWVLPVVVWILCAGTAIYLASELGTCRSPPQPCDRPNGCPMALGKRHVRLRGNETAAPPTCTHLEDALEGVGLIALTPLIGLAMTFLVWTCWPQVKAAGAM